MRVSASGARFVSLQTKFLLGTILLIVLIMSAVVILVEQRQRQTIVEEVQRRGEVLVRNLAAISSAPLLLYDYTALEQNVARIAEDADVAYAIIIDAESKIAAHSQEAALIGSRASGPPVRREPVGDGVTATEVVATEGESVYDFALPILASGQLWGTARIGLSKRRMEVEIAETRRELVLLAVSILTAGGLATALVARRIAGPVRQLAAGAVAISRGDLYQPIPPTTSDEIGQLAVAFNHMASELARQRAALETAHGELRRQFAELSDVKSYTDHILGSLTSGVLTLDLGGRVVTLNAAGEALTGSALAAIGGLLAADALPHIPELVQLLSETRTRGLGGTVVSVIPAGGGQMVPVEMTTAPLKGADGHDLGVVAVLRDLSAERQLEDQLRRSDRLAAIGTLAAGLAHEVKNPLTSLLTFTRHLSRRFGDERFRQRFQSVVPRELERINRIVENLLRLARPTQLSLAAVHLPELLEQVVELYEEQIEVKQITVAREYTHALPTLQADPAHLYQAFVNLVANALEAMGEGGILTLRVAWSQGGSSPGHPGGRWARERRLQVEVHDTGTGIPASESANVFNPFFTTKPAGTGLGLALAHKIVEDHGGSISFHSSPGRGTTFVVLLPLGRGWTGRGTPAVPPLHPLRPSAPSVDG